MSKKFTIEVNDLTHYYGKQLAVDHISFVVEQGKVLGLLGPNGAGKSTTIKMLATLLPISSGSARIGGFEIAKRPQVVRQLIGYVPQSLSADGDLTGYENLLFSAKIYGIPPKKREERINELLEFMGLFDSKDKMVNEYSGGMIRRLEIAQALIHRPEVLFLDEPTVGLDPSARRVLWDRIEFLRKEYGTTILLTTHDMLEADLLCNQVAFMHLGQIAAIDSPKTLKAAIGSSATLEDVFVYYTGSSISEGGNYHHVKEIRRRHRG